MILPAIIALSATYLIHDLYHNFQPIQQKLIHAEPVTTWLLWPSFTFRPAKQYLYARKT